MSFQQAVDRLAQEVRKTAHDWARPTDEVLAALGQEHTGNAETLADAWQEGWDAALEEATVDAGWRKNPYEVIGDD